MKRSALLLITICCLIYFDQLVFAQDTLQTKENITNDSSIAPQNLSEVVINAYEENKKLINEPSPIFNLSGNDLDRYNNETILPAVNTIPGVRMEERSPASYRLNIRGSSLRSPFGVREVKIYYNGIPVTDPTGDTYLNQFSFSDFGSVEVIKGPAGSAYGAGIGGVMLISSPLASHYTDSGFSATANYTAGSYDKQGINASIRWGNKRVQNLLSYSGLHSNGYRDHTEMRQKVFSYESLLHPDNKQQLDVIIHYNDLYYQTPGALTLAQYQQNPKLARQASGPYPSAVTSQAAVFQKNLLIGINQTYFFNNHFQNTTALYGSYTDFTNPTFLNYEYRKEPHFGGRTVFKYEQQKSNSLLTLLAGTEMQQGYFSQKDFGNSSGTPDTMQDDYLINNFQSLIFAQADLELKHQWDFTAGASINLSNIQFINLYPYPYDVLSRNFKNRFIPRIAVLKKFNNIVAVYASVEEGFSPPTVSELLPSTNVLNTSLNAETGIDYEIGSRGNILHQKLYYDITGFIFNLTQSISERVDSSGADYYVNAGGTLQHGIEAYFLYRLLDHSPGIFRSINIWTSQTWFHFLYRNYQVINADYSGKQLPGMAPYSSVSGLNFQLQIPVSFYFSWNYTDKIPLNDANTAFAAPYNLIDARLEYSHSLCLAFSLDIFAGVDNLLNETYSLGDDVNASGKRYYNAAPGITYTLGISLQAK